MSNLHSKKEVTRSEVELPIISQLCPLSHFPDTIDTINTTIKLESTANITFKVDAGLRKPMCQEDTSLEYRVRTSTSKYP